MYLDCIGFHVHISIAARTIVVVSVVFFFRAPIVHKMGVFEYKAVLSTVVGLIVAWLASKLVVLLKDRQRLKNMVRRLFPFSVSRGTVLVIHRTRTAPKETNLKAVALTRKHRVLIN